MIRPFLLFILVAAATAGARSTTARTILVPENEATIAGALGRSSAGDTVLVAPGRYIGAIRIADGVSLIARAGPDSTVIDGAGRGPVVSFGEVGASTLLEGFTVTGGVLTDEHGDGAGIRCARHAAPRLNHNWITGNRALGPDGRGGGIACLDGASPVIANSRIEGNEAADGGGIYVGKRRGTFESSPVIGGNQVLHNRARRRGGGLAVSHSSEPVVNFNVVAWNVALEGGGGVSIERAQPQIAANVIWANHDSSATAAGILVRDFAAPIVERNILALNRGGPAVSCERQFQERQAFRCNDLWGNPEGEFSPECAVYPGNLSLDPELCNPEAGEFGLRASSPCREAPGCGRIGAFGVGCAADSTAVGRHE